MKIILAGLPKSGTTWFYYRLLRSMPRRTVSFYEDAPPARWVKPRYALLTKLLIGPLETEDFARFEDYDRKIFLFRDPRDQLVSQLIYEAAYHVLPELPSENARDFKAMLQRKEQAPSEIPIHVLFCKAWNCSLDAYLFWAQETQRKVLLFKSLYPDYFMVKYRELLEDRVLGLEDYLGFRLKPARVPEEYSRVVRARNRGSWRHWLTEEDVHILKPLLRESLQAGDYDDTDWDLASRPEISEEHASEFFDRVYEERRAQKKRAQNTGDRSGREIHDSN